MESIKKLEDAAKECLKDLRSIDSKVSIAEGRLSSFEAKGATLAAEVTDLETKKAAILSFIGSVEANSRRAQEDKIADLRAKESQLDNERADLKAKQYQADEARRTADEMKAKFDALFREYQAKSEELNQKKEQLSHILK